MIRRKTPPDSLLPRRPDRPPDPLSHRRSRRHVLLRGYQRPGTGHTVKHHTTRSAFKSYLRHLSFCRAVSPPISRCPPPLALVAWPAPLPSSSCSYLTPTYPRTSASSVTGVNKNSVIFSYDWTFFYQARAKQGFSRIKKIPYQAPPTQLGPRKCTFWKKAFLGPKYQC